jgi:hypothetical protein
MWKERIAFVGVALLPDIAANSGANRRSERSILIDDDF